MSNNKTEFAVIYQWLIKPGKETQFRKAWEGLTLLQMNNRGSRGSRLHKSEQGTWIAYAQWVDKKSWEASCEQKPEDEMWSQLMLDAVEDTWPPTFLAPIADHLMPEQLASQGLTGPHVKH
ncbi:antibiotic biosynthesis monooxygenase [Stenotrophobium rhamnosiphilum]|uniref:antibiotic biosynthesis monooxygenase n=1 Tax=Stenotrophobium rhamnosiphilum TaxID=2029166 RepID=UPI0011B27DEF|nr:antibiotic biosynthesis monooxygenase [Stenotrophobium rhamnosiphilum]